MLFSWLVWLALLSAPRASAPPAPVRVTITPLTKAAYESVRCVVTKPRLTFPLKKQRGRLAIPLAKGQRVFTDVDIDDAAVKRGHSEDEVTTYTYRGYLPDFRCHFIQVQFYETTQWLLLSETGHLIALWGEPVFAPDGKHVAASCQGLEYGGGQPNIVQVLALRNGELQEVWKLEPKTWEPEEICWSSASTLLLRRETWTQKTMGGAYTYARLTLH